jgi:hypothetical protein
MILMIVRWEAAPCEGGQLRHSLRMLKLDLENNSRQPNNPKQQANGSLRKKEIYSLFCRVLAKGDLKPMKKIMMSVNQSY